MAIKAIIFTDPECKKLCDDAIQSMEEYIKKGEMEVMEVGEALKQGYDLGDPEGVPFIGFVSESTRKCINKAVFHDEHSGVVLQRYVSEVEGGRRKLASKVSHINPQTGEETLETDQG